MRIVTVGDDRLLTEGRRTRILDRMSSDPRVATVSLMAANAPRVDFVPATSPAGGAIAISTYLHDLLGPVPVRPHTYDSPEFATALHMWAREASNRGFRHLWWMIDAPDVVAATPVLRPQAQDRREASDPTSAMHAANDRQPNANITLTVHAGWLGPSQTGAQVVITEAVHHLASDPRISFIRLVGVDRLPNYASHLRDLPTVSIEETQTESQGVGATTTLPTDIVWYPNQPDASFNLREARSFGRRTVVTYLDLIAYDIARYHTSAEDWDSYRALQRRTCLAVDGVTTISGDVAMLLHAEVPLLEPSRVRAVPLGVDHLAFRNHCEVLDHDEDLDDLEAALEGRRFVLVLGNDFVHKNRDFAIRVWAEVANQGFDGDIVLAGLHVGRKSSRSSETLTTSERRQGIHSVGHVTSQSREWLLSNAAAVLYPTSAEGFGLVPHEAAALGTPVVFTAFGPLVEILPLDDVPRAWTIEAYAADLSSILQGGDAAARRVEQLRAAQERHTWSAFAEGMAAFFLDVAAMPPVVTSNSFGLHVQVPPGVGRANRGQRARSAANRIARRSIPWLARRISRT